jgi:hypothetical protein
MMAKRNRNIKNIFIKLQLGTNIMANAKNVLIGKSDPKNNKYKI